ncbi:SEC-C metal-binding domain-containing protein (plasmid) [Clostridium perfringens]
MERNEKCFCGSGIKYKKCHYGVYENSLVGKK